MSKTTKHYHYVDSPTMPHRLVIALDPVKTPRMPYGAIEWVYDPSSTEADFVSNRLEEIQPFVRNGFLVIQDVFEVGTIVTVALQPGYELENILLHEMDALDELVVETKVLDSEEVRTGMLYWIQVGRTGAFSLKATVGEDEDGKIQKLRSHIGDIPLREYLARRARARIDRISEEDFAEYPSTMDTKTAARYLDRSPSWLYDKAQKGLIRRTPDKHFLREDLDEYQRREVEAKKRHGTKKMKQ